MGDDKPLPASELEPTSADNGNVPQPTPTTKPWKIYPPPPKPHWERRDPFTAKPSVDVEDEQVQQEFRMEDCEIPGEHPFMYEMDSQGIFQVYKDESTREFTFTRIFFANNH